MRTQFCIYGEPRGKERPKFSTVCGHVTARTPENTVLYENLVKTEPHLAEEIACNGFGTVQVGDHEEPEKIVVECLECGGILLEVENPNARKGDAE